MAMLFSVSLSPNCRSTFSRAARWLMGRGSLQPGAGHISQFSTAKFVHQSVASEFVSARRQHSVQMDFEQQVVCCDDLVNSLTRSLA